jgi:mono/diheme cytochrome c family protein
VRIVVAVAAAVWLAGCSGAQPTSRGRVVFERSCAGCHTLTGHDTSARGGDLRVGRLDAADVASFARVMPLRTPLSAADARAVGRYVASR